MLFISKNKIIKNSNSKKIYSLLYKLVSFLIFKSISDAVVSGIYESDVLVLYNECPDVKRAAYINEQIRPG